MIEGVRPGNPGKGQISAVHFISSTQHIFFPLVFQHSIDVLPEVARCYGKSVNGKAIRNFYDRTIKHDVKAVLDTLEAGGDPEDLQLSGIAKIGGGTKGQRHTTHPQALSRLPHPLYFFLFILLFTFYVLSLRFRY